MQKTIALKLVGGLSTTSKMPGPSFGLPTDNCITGSKLAQIPGTVCSTCYAMKGYYRLYAKTVLPAQQRRLAAFSDPLWVEAMIKAIGSETHFRWFDSGDLQSVEMLLKIFEVARGTPACKHWVATRERSFVRQALIHSKTPENLVIRVSAAFPDIAVRPMGIDVQYANVHMKGPPLGFECRAPSQGGQCGTCRACWSREVEVVSYHQH